MIVRGSIHGVTYDGDFVQLNIQFNELDKQLIDQAMGDNTEVEVVVVPVKENTGDAASKA